MDTSRGKITPQQTSNATNPPLPSVPPPLKLATKPNPNIKPNPTKPDIPQSVPLSENALHRAFLFDTPAPQTLHSFVLYEAPHVFVVVGHHMLGCDGQRACGNGGVCSVAMIHRGNGPANTADGENRTGFPVVEHLPEYMTRAQVQTLLTTTAGSGGGLTERLRFHALCGFIRFTSVTYLVAVTQCRLVGLLGTHRVYAIQNTEMVPLCSASFEKSKEFRALRAQEARYRHLLDLTDMSRHFYFSYTTNLGLSIQAQALTKRNELLNLGAQSNVSCEDRFTWNEHLRTTFSSAGGEKSAWCVRIIHGYFAQRLLGVYGARFRLTLVARRSAEFAGTRFLKRGVNAAGNVANDVEVEQILSDDFSLKPINGITSFTQMRGSVPLFWSQDTSMLDPKPEIDLLPLDPMHVCAMLHIRDLLARYSGPIVVMNLVKQFERRPRESRLAEAFGHSMAHITHTIDRLYEPETSQPTTPELHYHNNNNNHTKKHGEKETTAPTTSHAHSSPTTAASPPTTAAATPSSSSSSPASPSVVQRTPPTSPTTARQQPQAKRNNSSNNNNVGNSNSNNANPGGKKSRHHRSIASELLQYKAWDFSMHAKAKGTNVVEELNKVLFPVLNTMGFFHMKSDLVTDPTIGFQKGVLRVNCIDCLDRTNVAQLCMAKLVLGYQFHKLGVLSDPIVAANTPVVDTLIQMYENLGDALSMQYGGSEAVKSGKLDKIKRSLNVGPSDSRQTQNVVSKIVTNAQRFYSNVMTDFEKQTSMNLLLGKFTPIVIETSRLRSALNSSEISSRDTGTGEDSDTNSTQSSSLTLAPSSSTSNIFASLVSIISMRKQQKDGGQRSETAEGRVVGGLDEWKTPLSEGEKAAMLVTLNPPIWEYDHDFHLHNPVHVIEQNLLFSHRRVPQLVHEMMSIYHLHTQLHSATFALTPSAKTALVLCRRERQRATNRVTLLSEDGGVTVFDHVLASNVQSMLEDCVSAMVRFRRKSGDRQSGESDADDSREEDDDRKLFKRWFVFSKAKISENTLAAPLMSQARPRPSMQHTTRQTTYLASVHVSHEDAALYRQFVDLGKGNTIDELAKCTKTNEDNDVLDDVNERALLEFQQYFDVPALCTSPPLTKPNPTQPPVHAPQKRPTAESLAARSNILNAQNVHTNSQNPQAHTQASFGHQPSVVRVGSSNTAATHRSTPMSPPSRPGSRVLGTASSQHFHVPAPRSRPITQDDEYGSNNRRWAKFFRRPARTPTSPDSEDESEDDNITAPIPEAGNMREHFAGRHRESVLIEDFAEVQYPSEVTEMYHSSVWENHRLHEIVKDDCGLMNPSDIHLYAWEES